MTIIVPKDINITIPASTEIDKIYSLCKAYEFLFELKKSSVGIEALHIWYDTPQDKRTIYIVRTLRQFYAVTKTIRERRHVDGIEQFISVYLREPVEAASTFNTASRFKG